MGISSVKRIEAYSSLHHLHLKPSFHNEYSLIKYPLCVCRSHQTPIWIKKNGKLEQLSAIPLFMPYAHLSGMQLSGYSVCKPGLSLFLSRALFNYLFIIKSIEGLELPIIIIFNPNIETFFDLLCLQMGSVSFCLWCFELN